MNRKTLVLCLLLALHLVPTTASATTCENGGRVPRTIPFVVASGVAMVGNLVYIANGERAGAGWRWTGYLGGAGTIVGGVLVYEDSWAPRCDRPTDRMHAKSFIAVGVLSIVLSAMGSRAPEPEKQAMGRQRGEAAADESPGWSTTFVPWISATDDGSPFLGGGMIVRGF